MQSGILLIVQTAPQAKAYSPILTHTHCRCIHSNHSVYTMLHCQPPVNPISQSSSWPTVRNQNDFRSSFYMALERVGCIDLSNPPIIHEGCRYVALFFWFLACCCIFFHLGVVLTSPAKCESANWLQIIKNCKIIYLTVEGKLLTLILIRSWKKCPPLAPLFICNQQSWDYKQ